MIKVVTYNLHKGRSPFGKQIVFESLKQILHDHEFDIGLFQEVLGHHKLNKEIAHQIELLADEKWKEFAFAKNSVVANYDHGNSILSKFPILEEKILDLTLNPFEKRCAVFTKLDLAQTEVYCVCTHLNLGQRARLRQAKSILDFIDKNIGAEVPIILGGDFNDWNGKVSNFFQDKGGFQLLQQPAVKSFPSFFPVLPLDRVLCRNLQITAMHAGDGRVFRKYSDHLPIFCDFEVLSDT